MCITWQITNFLTIIWISDNQNKLIQVIIHNNNHNHNCYYLYYLYFFQLQYITMNTYIYWATNVSLMEMVFDHFSLNTTLKNGRQTFLSFYSELEQSSYLKFRNKCQWLLHVLYMCTHWEAHKHVHLTPIPTLPCHSLLSPIIKIPISWSKWSILYCMLSMVSCVISFLLNWSHNCFSVRRCHNKVWQLRLAVLPSVPGKHLLFRNDDFKGSVDLELHLAAIVASPGNLD